RLAESRVAHRLDRLVRERARARDHTDAALAMDGARDDPDLGTPRGRRAGAVGADQPGAGRLDDGDRGYHVEHRDALGDAEDRRDAGVGRLHDRVGRATGRDEDAGRVRDGLADGVSEAAEDRDRAVEGPEAALAGRDPGDDPGAVLEHRPRVELALATGDALDEQRRVGPDEDAHRAIPARAPFRISRGVSTARGVVTARAA